jgi:mycofactocin system creatininase family protein
VQLGPRTWTGLGAPLLLVPVGSCEQHGPHLPLHTDTVIATAVADGAAARHRNAVVAPALTITASGEHQGFPGTLSIGTAVMASVVVELVRSADWADGVVLVNGHGGNLAAVESAVAGLRDEGRRVLAWWPRLAAGDLHAGRTETSLMLALAPAQVVLDAAVAGPVPPIAELIERGVAAVSASGVLGDPAGASAEEGHALLERLVEQLVASVAAWRAT